MASNSNLVRGALTINKAYKRNGLKSYVRALQKYNINPTVDGPYCMINKVEQQGSQSIMKKFHRKIGGRAHVKGHVLAKKDATTGQTGDVPATDTENNAEYLATVGIGTPAQNMNLDFDTGSADLWVWSTELPSSVISEYGASHNIFDSSKSSTFKTSSGSTWQIQYGDGSTASGNVGTDNVNAGGLIVEGQAIELAETLSSAFETGPGDGLLGLAFGSINTVQPTAVNTLVENMIAQQDIKQGTELFTAYLGSVAPASASSTSSTSGSSSGADATSFYTFGYIDTDVTNGQTPLYAPVDNSQGFWMFNSTSAMVGTQTVTRTGNTAIADTGTTLALVGDDLCEAIYGAIPGATQNSQQQAWVFPTSTDLSTLPQIQFAVGDNLFTVNPEELPFQDLGDGTYYGGIQSRGDQDFDIFGDVFLRSVYAIFDQGNTQFGAVQRASTLTSSSTGSTTGGSTTAGSSY